MKALSSHSKTSEIQTPNATAPTAERPPYFPKTKMVDGNGNQPASP